MKKFLFASAIAAMIVPSIAIAQEANVPLGTTQSETSTTGTMEAAPAGAMATGEASTTSDSVGSYTIITKTLADNAGTNSGQDANRNTDPAAIQRTIDANPGLAEKLEAEGVMMENIGSISVGPSGQVTVFSKG